MPHIDINKFIERHDKSTLSNLESRTRKRDAKQKRKLKTKKAPASRRTKTGLKRSKTVSPNLK